MEQPQNTQNRHERGNVLFMILAAVALFAALGFAMTQSSVGTGDINREEARAHAIEILQYAESIKNAVDKTRLVKSCSVNQISFDTPELNNYVNPNSPSDNRCHIFSSSGGGAKYIAPKEEYLSGSGAGPIYGKMLFTGKTCLMDKQGGNCNSDGIDNEDLVMFIDEINEQVCIEINKNLGIGTGPFENLSGDLVEKVPLDDGCMFTYGNPNEFKGTFSEFQNISGNLTDKTLNGQPVACAKHMGCNQEYVFYRVLVNR